ncbi:hypothetical protein CFOL_v3_21812, partial [Cephalotus follicularis]
TMASNSREGRRRKIVERGSDRLALITGRIQSVPPPSSSPPPPLDSSLPLPHPFSQITFSSNGEDEPFGSTLLKRDRVSDANQTNTDDGGSSVESTLHGTSIEAAEAPALEDSVKAMPSLISSTDRDSSISTLDSEQVVEQQKHQKGIYSPKHISSCIAASESARLYCSATVALLVVLSYLGFPILRSNFIKSIISWSPLYLVLLTNITIVLARLLFGNQRGFERSIGEKNKNTLSDGYGWAEQASKVLEVVLVIQKAMNAVFMDCSVYAVIVICGLSFT